MKNLTKKFNYVYIITNLVNKKQYIGDRSTNKIPKKDNYLGSGTYLKKAKKKYGKENFEKRILELFESKYKAFNAQEKYIKEYNTLSPNGYNISWKGGHQCKNSVSNETKRKISESLKGEKHPLYGKTSHMKGKKHSEETKRKMSEAKKGNFIPWNKGIKMSEETKEKLSKSLSGKNHPNWGKCLSKETKEKISKNNIGKHNFNHTEEAKMKIRISSIGRNLGKKHTKEAKRKMSEARLGKKRGKYKIK